MLRIPVKSWLTQLKKLINILHLIALGILSILAWSSLLSVRGSACPIFEGTLISKTILVPLDFTGAIVCFLVVVLVAKSTKKLISLVLVAATMSALLASLWASSSLPLLAMTIIVLVYWLLIRPNFFHLRSISRSLCCGIPSYNILATLGSRFTNAPIRHYAASPFSVLLFSPNYAASSRFIFLLFSSIPTIKENVSE